MKKFIKKIFKLLLFPVYVQKRFKAMEERFKAMEEWVQKIDENLTECYYYNLSNKIGRSFNVAYADKKMRDMIEFLRPITLKDFSLVRIGKESDGGYVMVDNWKGSEAAYSLGVGNEDTISWDLQISEKNIPVFMYDHTVDSPQNLRHNMYFHKIGICAKETESTENMNTIENLIVQNKHEDAKNLILGMDIEGAEWDIFDNISTERLLQFKQIVCEFHDFTKENIEDNDDFYNKIMRVFEKLSKYYYIVNLHINNASLPRKIFGIYFPSLLELSFIRKDEGMECSSEWTCNNELNFPNIPKFCDIDISYLFSK